MAPALPHRRLSSPGLVPGALIAAVWALLWAWVLMDVIAPVARVTAPARPAAAFVDRA